jgi:hypothetical protein
MVYSAITVPSSFDCRLAGVFKLQTILKKGLSKLG